MKSGMGMKSGVKKFIAQMNNYSMDNLARDCSNAGIELNTTPDTELADKYGIINANCTIDGVYYINDCPQTFNECDHRSIVIFGKPGCIRSE
jgi:hypothetical protein